MTEGVMAIIKQAIHIQFKWRNAPLEMHQSRRHFQLFSAQRHYWVIERGHFWRDRAGGDAIGRSARPHIYQHTSSHRTVAAQKGRKKPLIRNSNTLGREKNKE